MQTTAAEQPAIVNLFRRLQAFGVEFICEQVSFSGTNGGPLTVSEVCSLANGARPVELAASRRGLTVQQCERFFAWFRSPENNRCYGQTAKGSRCRELAKWARDNHGEWPEPARKFTAQFYCTHHCEGPYHEQPFLTIDLGLGDD